MAKQDIAMQVLQQVVKLPVVKVDREKFLVEKFSKELDRKDIPTLIEQGPTALLPQESLDRVAKACIKDNVLLASGTSVLAGLPGGIVMAITIPTDVAQFYAFSLKLAQELGYIYGFDDLWASRNELSEDAKNTLVLYLGVMLGDLSVAKVYYTILSNLASDNQKAQIGLEKATGTIKRELGRNLKLYKIPDLTFVKDGSIEYGNKIDEMLRNLDKN